MEEKWQTRLRELVALEFSANRVTTADDLVREIRDEGIELPQNRQRLRSMIAEYRRQERGREVTAGMRKVYETGVTDGRENVISLIEDLLLPALPTQHGAVVLRFVATLRGETTPSPGRLLTDAELNRLDALGYGVGWDDDDPDKTQFNHVVKTRDTDLADRVPLCGSERLWFSSEPFWSSRGDGSWVDEDRRLKCADCLALLPALLGFGDTDASR